MDASSDRLVREFCDRTLPKQEWTHHAHLRVGLWHVLEFGEAQAMEMMRERIKAYNLACGGENTETAGYHESITRFFIWLIARFLEAEDRRRSFPDLADELVLLFNDKNLPLQYWTRELLFTPAARLGWVEPNIRPLA